MGIFDRIKKLNVFGSKKNVSLQKGNDFAKTYTIPLYGINFNWQFSVSHTGLPSASYFSTNPSGLSLISA